MICYVMLCYRTHVMLYYISRDMLSYITYVMLVLALGLYNT